jgi:hypothetical protein
MIGVVQRNKVFGITNTYLSQSAAGVLLALVAALFVMSEGAHARKQVSKDSHVSWSRSEIPVSIKTSRRQEAEQIDSSETQAFEHMSSDKRKTWSLACDYWCNWFFGSNDIYID